MQLQTTFELSMVLDSVKFHKVLTRTSNNAEYFDKNEDKYVDQSLASKGITVTYRDSQYKKKVKLIVNSNLVLGVDEPDPDKLIRKLEKSVDEYFGSKYQIDDFDLSGMVLSTDINVNSRADVSSYLKVLQRIGKVKGFSPTSYDCFDDASSFCLEGNSNGINFFIYDLEALLTSRLRNSDFDRKKFKSMIEESKGILRAEVRLTEPKAIMTYTDKTDTCNQIAALSEKSQDIFLSTFMRVIPFGDFHKKDKAVEIIRQKVKDIVLRRRMLRLVALIPEKKSISLAQKELNYRRIDDIMNMFAAIDLSPVTLSKRHDVKWLKNLYAYL